MKKLRDDKRQSTYTHTLSNENVVVEGRGVDTHSNSRELMKNKIDLNKIK